MNIQVMLRRVEVKSVKMSLESFVEDGERFCCCDFGLEFIPLMRWQNREESLSRLFLLSEMGAPAGQLM